MYLGCLQLCLALFCLLTTVHSLIGILINLASSNRCSIKLVPCCIAVLGYRNAAKLQALVHVFSTSQCNYPLQITTLELTVAEYNLHIPYTYST